MLHCHHSQSYCTVWCDNFHWHSRCRNVPGLTLLAPILDKDYTLMNALVSNAGLRKLTDLIEERLAEEHQTSSHLRQKKCSHRGSLSRAHTDWPLGGISCRPSTKSEHSWYNDQDYAMTAPQYIAREALLATAAAFDVLVQDADCYGRVGFQNVAREGVRSS